MYQRLRTRTGRFVAACILPALSQSNEFQYLAFALNHQARPGEKIHEQRCDCPFFTFFRPAESGHRC